MVRSAPHSLVAALVSRDRPISRREWDAFWDRLSSSPARRREAVAVLSSLSTRRPDADSVCALVDSLTARHDLLAARDAVNIVGTGGGPRTVNVSTAAALVAAATGARVVKTGSRAFTSPLGSLDLLEKLRIPLATCEEDLDEQLERHGIAFAGGFVYPPELVTLAQLAAPLPMRTIGRCFNAIGPLLARIPLTAQVTGVADATLLPALRRVAVSRAFTTIWLCHNQLGVDELISFAPNVVWRSDSESELQLLPSRLGLAAGDLGALRPAADPAGAVDQFTALLAGEGPPEARQTVCLNAAAIAISAGVADDWEDAVEAARAAIADGAPMALLERLRRRPPIALPVSRATVR
jgi:anthranilate phosphoribosyltransferase